MQFFLDNFHIPLNLRKKLLFGLQLKSYLWTFSVKKLIYICIYIKIRTLFLADTCCQRKKITINIKWIHSLLRSKFHIIGEVLSVLTHHLSFSINTPLYLRLLKKAMAYYLSMFGELLKRLQTSNYFFQNRIMF